MPAASSTLYIDPRVYSVTSLANLRLQAGVGITGALAVCTGLGLYQYSATSTAADDGTTTVKPFDIDVSAAGRWIRVAS